MGVAPVDITFPNGKKYKQPTGLFIDGDFVESKSGKKFSVENPSTEEEICQVYEADEADVDRAVDAAEKAFKDWGFEDVTKRGNYLLKLADLVHRDAELLASIESIDNGKPFHIAMADIKLVEDVFRNYGGWADKNFGQVVETDNDHFTVVKREPIGVVGCVIPWNFPLLMAAWKLGPAMCTGNCTVLKTAESTPLSALYLCTLMNEIGLPKGVVNIISGYGKTGGYISSHMRIKKVAFTGSTATGRKIMESAAKSNLKNVTLELGGKSPNVVFEDADLEQALENVNAGIYFNSGEVCSAGSRVYVQESIYDKFLDMMKQRAEQNVVGDPFDKKTFYGPQTSKMQLDRVLDYIEHGKNEGARLVTGGSRLDRKGYFMKPTIFADVKEGMKIVNEEIFGPVVTVAKFKDTNEALQLANNTEYGLAAGIHTSDVNRAIYVSSRIRAGSVWVNTFNDFHHQVPFGGYGQSGIGRELGQEVLNNYCHTKSVRMAIKFDPSK